MKCYKLIALFLCFAVMIGCEKDQQADSKTDTEMTLSDQDQIKAMLHELIDRVKEGDKTVLYENEFQYLTDSLTLSDYMEIPRVLDYKYDSLYGVEIDSIKMMDDSAVVLARIQYYSDGGGQTERLYPLMVYYYKDKWIRPYLSRHAQEVEYQEMLKAYREAVSGEKSGE